MPDSKIIIKCHDCEHPIDEHVHGKCDLCVGTCQLSANDIALYLVFDELTPDPHLRELRRG